MSTDRTLVSVIVPCYGHARYLPDAVKSLVDQTHDRWECLIINDGSPDDTREVATELMRSDPRVRYFEQPNGGVGRARNRGLAQAAGDYLHFLDADDIMLPAAFQSALEAAARVSDRCVVISDYWLMDECGRRFENAMCTPEFKLGTPTEDVALRWETELSIPAHAFLFDSRLFRRHAIRFSETLPNHEDWDCWMRILTLRPVVVRVREKLAIYRVLGESMSRNDERMWRGFRQAIEMQIERCVDDAELRRMLVYKRKLTDDFYGKTLRARMLPKLRRSRWFNGAFPQSLRRSVLRRLDLTDLDAHGWLK